VALARLSRPTSVRGHSRLVVRYIRRETDVALSLSRQLVECLGTGAGITGARSNKKLEEGGNVSVEKLTKKVTSGRWKTNYYENESGEVVSKECRKCKELKLLDEFYPAKDCLAMRRASCKDCELSINRKYHKDDRRRSADRKKKWKDANRSKSLETLRTWYANNKDEINARRRERGHPGNARRKERLDRLLNTWTIAERESALEYFGGCAFTGSIENIQFDHVIPISTGHAGTVVWNMLPMTAELNLSKSTKHVVVWFHENKERLNLDDSRFNRALEYLADAGGFELDDFLEYNDWCHDNKTKLGGIDI
jgi:hypothetical protein